MSRRSCGVAAYCTATPATAGKLRHGYRLANRRHEEKTINYQPSSISWHPACDFAGRQFERFSSTRTDLEAAREGSVGKIRQPTHVYFPAGNVAANDLTAWSVRQLSGQRRCEWPEYHWRRCKRMRDLG